MALAGFATDRTTKMLAERYLEIQTPKPLLGSYLQLTLWYNEGAAFGVRLGGPWVHTILSLMAMVLIAYLIWQTPRREAFNLTSYGLIMGGALGNLWDRLFTGRVTDFIEMGIGRYHWPTFNVADACVVIGIVLLIIAHSYSSRSARSHDDEQVSSAAGSQGATAGPGSG